MTLAKQLNFVAIHGFGEVSNSGSYCHLRKWLFNLVSLMQKFVTVYFMLNKMHYARYNPDSSPFFAMISSENSSVCRNLDFLILSFGFDTRYGLYHISFMKHLEKFRKWTVSPSTRQISTCYCCRLKRGTNR